MLISTWGFPPVSGGTSAILYELFRHFPREEIVAVHSIADPPTFNVPDLGVERSMVVLLGSYKWTLRCMRRLPQVIIPVIRRRIIQLARKFGVRRIYAHFPNDCFVIAAWQAAQTLGLPLTVYLDILWQESGAGNPAMAAKYEHRVLQAADQRFAITEFAVDYLHQKHGLKFELIPHVIDAANLPAGLRPLPQDRPPVVHFSGGIYATMNLDSMVRLAEAASLAKLRPAIDLCTPDLPAPLAERGLTCRYLSRPEVMQAQSQSTLLYLPQAFHSGRPEMIRHNFPTKAMDYVCSGRPILVHSPPDSYLAFLARREGFGLVVDRPDAQELAAAIDRLAADSSLQQELVARALEFARKRDSKKWAERLWSALITGVD
ncbi:MAG: glycosyltransferase [Thermoguttaceae bacterium]